MSTLNKVALLGTTRVTETPSTGTPVDGLIAGIGDVTPERRLLLTAGMLGVFRRAGYIPPIVASLPAPAPAESVPACSRGAARVLGDIFIDGRFELLPEAFQLLTRAGQRVPFPLLVDCLDLRDRVHREAARPVLGERGVWLAHQRADWEWARATVALEPDAAELERLWDEGRSDDRLAALARLRDLDATRARVLLASSWKQEPAEFRLSALSALASRLSRDDEEFLQAALGDRGGAVRAAAASLLSRLGDSTFAARAIARADMFLDVRRAQSSGVWDRMKAAVASDDQQLTVSVRSPERFDPVWETDGISAKPPRGVGERAHWLIQAVGLVDPAYWCERAGAPASELTRAAWRGEWGAAVMTAWTRAALSHGSTDWIVALWDAWLNADVSADPNAAVTRRELLMPLFRRMPAAAAQERAAALLQAPALAADLDLEALLDRFERPWPDALGARVLDAIDVATASAGSTAWGSQVARLLRTAGPAIPAGLFERALALVSRDPAGPIPTRTTVDFDVFAHQIRLRQRLYQELAR